MDGEDELHVRHADEVAKLDARIAELEAALRVVDDDVRHHLRHAYANGDSIPSALIRAHAIKAVRDALGLTESSR